MRYMIVHAHITCSVGSLEGGMVSIISVLKKIFVIIRSLLRFVCTDQKLDNLDYVENY